MTYAPSHRSSQRPVRRSSAWLHLSTWSRRGKLFASIAGAIMAGSVAFAVTTWTVGLGTGSSSQAQSGSVQNITIVASASPTPTNLLYPGASGDVVAKITNPNPFQVTITAVQLPANTSAAVGYTDAALNTANSSCTATTSAVTFVGSTGTSGSSHTLSSAINVAANSNINIVFTNEATMGTGSDNSCQATYFKMPSFPSVTATVGTGTATTTGTAVTWS